MKVSVIAGSCEMYVYGLDMRCPLCKTLVRSGERHSCKPFNINLPAEKKRRKRNALPKNSR
jgi:hypothetical protein